MMLSELCPSFHFFPFNFLFCSLYYQSGHTHMVATMTLKRSSFKYSLRSDIETTLSLLILCKSLKRDLIGSLAMLLLQVK